MLDALLLAADPAAGAPVATALFSVESLIAFLTLTALEIVLGIDNVVFIAIICAKLPPEKQDFARRLGLVLAAVMRIALLSVIWIILKLDDHSFLIPLIAHEITIKDGILLAGGLFLLAKAVWEIHHTVHHPVLPQSLGGKNGPGGGGTTAGAEGAGRAGGKVALTSVRVALMQIIALDLVFSIDSVLTAAGMTDQIVVMVAAVLVSVGVMLAASGPIARFVNRNPTLKVLALAFLVLIGVLLIAEGWGQHFSKGYVYFAMAFSLLVEMLQIRQTRVRERKVAASADGAGPDAGSGG